MNKTFIQPLPLLAIDSSTITGTYQLLNAAGFTVAVKKLRLVNGSDKTVIVSYDGITDHAAVIPNWIIDPEVYADSTNGYDQIWKKGTKIYVKGTAGTGFFYVESYYQPN